MHLVTINEAALRRRINRRLARDGERLVCSRHWATRIDHGGFYIVDGNSILVDWDVDLEDLARELGVLRHYEGVA